MKIERIYLDMDGVLVDWFGGICDLMQLDRVWLEQFWIDGANTEQTLKIDQEHMWNLVNRHGSDWWAHLNPLPWTTELLGLFAETSAEISILTSPANSDYAATGKIRWLKHYMPYYVDRIHLTAQKHHVAREGVLLVDDSDINCERFIAAGGEAVLFPQVWNKKRVFSSSPMQSVRAQLKALGVTGLFPEK